MIETAYLFVAKHAKRNAKRILITSHPYLAGLLALCVSFDEYGFGSHFSVDQNFLLFQTYDTVIFGFTATATAITLTISSNSFLRFISTYEFDGRTAFRAATFVLAWNSFIHSLAFFAVFVAKNSLLWKSDLWVSNTDVYQRALLFPVLWLQFYAFFQFVVTNIALFEISDLFGQFLQKERKERGRED